MDERGTARNIVLAGFMGTGKTTVGREVARRLGRRFVDLDDLIVERAGKPIPEIFAEDGEPVFRALEAAICREMSTPAGFVIAAGGGAVVDPANREALARGGTMIRLEAAPETIIARLEGETNRPLLAGPDRLDRIRALLAQRAGAYASLPLRIDTADLTVAQVADKVMEMLIHPHLSSTPDGSRSSVHRLSSNIFLGPGALTHAGEHIVTAGIAPGRCAVITNPTVARYHFATLRRALESAGFDPLVLESPDGEAYKTLETVAGLYARLAEAKMARNEPIIALGGGVIGDMAGFVAATWLRGVPFVQLPTSLLAMVDASVGGKVAVDLPAGKNLVGAFKSAALVLIDPELLATLPEAEYRSGMAEVLKHGLIGDTALLDRLLAQGAPAQSGDVAALTEMIAQAVRVKIEIVERDPYEAGERAWLNLGHTFAHALELLSGFTLRHGEAVGLGLVAAAHLSHALGYCDATLPGTVRRGVERLGLPTVYRFDPVAALGAMGTDKKRRGRSLRFVLLKQPGDVVMVEDVPEQEVLAALETIHTE